eukprot:scaffold121323_cov42-Cyclotella_meneghiniana.AAC.1
MQLHNTFFKLVKGRFNSQLGVEVPVVIVIQHPSEQPMFVGLGDLRQNLRPRASNDLVPGGSKGKLDDISCILPFIEGWIGYKAVLLM